MGIKSTKAISVSSQEEPSHLQLDKCDNNQPEDRGKGTALLSQWLCRIYHKEFLVLALPLIMAIIPIINLQYFQHFLSCFQVRSDQIASATKAFMLNAAWEVVKSDPKVANAGFLASWFQETLHAYLPSIGTSILDCMAQLPVTCDGLATVYVWSKFRV